MAKQAYLDDEIIRKIAELFNGNKGSRGKEILDRINNWLKEKKSSRQISLSLVQRELAKLHKKDKELMESIGIKALDSPWSIGSLKNKAYDVLPESIPILLDMAAIRIRKGRPLLTVRGALWASRIYPVILSFKTPTNANEMATMVEAWIDKYLEQDIISELLGKENVNTQVLDWVLLQSRGDTTKFSELIENAPSFKDYQPTVGSEEIKAVKLGLKNIAREAKNGQRFHPETR